MVFSKRFFLGVIGLVLVTIISACGSTTSTGSTSSTPTSAATSTPTTAPTSTTASTFTVKTAQATVKGNAMTILTDAQGKTLYYYKPDTASKTACTGTCAQNWPPLLFTGTGKPTSSTHLAGELEVYKNANGNQVIYNDHPLYTFSGDSAAGQTNGEGIGGNWFVATPDLAKNMP